MQKYSTTARSLASPHRAPVATFLLILKAHMNISYPSYCQSEGSLGHEIILYLPPLPLC